MRYTCCPLFNQLFFLTLQQNNNMKTNLHLSGHSWVGEIVHGSIKGGIGV